MTLPFSKQQLDWLVARIPDAPKTPLGGRPPADKRKVISGILWVLTQGAKWEDLPGEFGSKSTAHRWFRKWAADGVFDAILRDIGICVEEHDGFKLYQCRIDEPPCRGRITVEPTEGHSVDGEGDFTVLVDAKGLPVAINLAHSSSNAERTGVTALPDIDSRRPEVSSENIQFSAAEDHRHYSK